jgi:hypothetical protein
MSPGGCERVDDRVHRRPERRAQQDERHRRERRLGRQHEEDREAGQERGHSADPQGGRACAQPRDDRAHDRVDRRRGGEEETDLARGDTVLPELERDEQVDAAAHEPDQDDDRDAGEYELVAPGDAKHLAQTLSRWRAGLGRRRHDEKRRRERRRDPGDEERRSGVVAIREGACERGSGREPEPGDRRRRAERSRAAVLAERIRQPRRSCAPQRPERDPEHEPREQQRPELLGNTLPERRQREEPGGGDRDLARAEAVGEQAQRERDDERGEARGCEDHPGLDAREAELVGERRRERDHRDPDERLEEDERVDRRDAAAHGSPQSPTEPRAGAG